MEIEIKITQEIEDDVTTEEIYEWVKYVTGYSGSMSLDNPLCDLELEAREVDFYEK